MQGRYQSDVKKISMLSWVFNVGRYWWGGSKSQSVYSPWEAIEEHKSSKEGSAIAKTLTMSLNYFRMRIFHVTEQQAGKIRIEATRHSVNVDFSSEIHHDVKKIFMLSGLLCRYQWGGSKSQSGYSPSLCGSHRGDLTSFENCHSTKFSFTMPSDMVKDTKTRWFVQLWRSKSNSSSVQKEALAFLYICNNCVGDCTEIVDWAYLMNAQYWIGHHNTNSQKQWHGSVWLGHD